MNQSIMDLIKLNPDPIRSSQKTILHGFDLDFEPFQYEVYGYAQGDKIDRLKNLTIFHFDSLEFITKSTNSKNGGDFIHAKGHRKREGSFKVIILKRKKNKK